MRFLTLSLIISTLLLLSACGGERTSYTLPEGIFLEAAHLDSALQSEAPTIIDFRQEVEYTAGHIPGAVNYWRQDIDILNADTMAGSIPRKEFTELLRSKGVKPSTPVVVYDDGELVNASKFAWLLLAYGQEDVHLLLGGLPRWKQRGFPIESGEPKISPSNFDFPAGKSNASMARSHDMLQAMADTQSVIVDVRDWSEFTGAERRGAAPRAGRIPHGVWLEYTELLHSVEGVLRPKPREEMLAILRSKGITPGKRILPYCQSGYRSACFCLLLSRELGYPDVMNYDGSWLDWSAHPWLPVDSGVPSSITVTIP